jgi:hypothetical protein
MNAKALALMAGGLVAAAGVGTAIGDLGSDDDGDRPLRELELRKDDGAGDVELVDEEDDRDDDKSGDKSRGPTQDPQTGSGDRTGGTNHTPGTGWSGDTGDGDATPGNDGTNGGENTYVEAAGDYVAPAPTPAPAPAYYGSDDGGSYSGGSD